MPLQKHRHWRRTHGCGGMEPFRQTFPTRISRFTRRWRRPPGLRQRRLPGTSWTPPRLTPASCARSPHAPTGSRRWGFPKATGSSSACLTSPQGVIAFYAADKLGAASHGTSALGSARIEQYLNATGARIVLTLDAFYGRFAHIKPAAAIEKIVLARIPDIFPLKAVGFAVTKGRKIPRRAGRPRCLVEGGYGCVPSASPARPSRTRRSSCHPVLGRHFRRSQGHRALEPRLHRRGHASGGLGRQRMDRAAVLAILPIFHGFGLGVCVNATLMKGGGRFSRPSSLRRSPPS